MLTMMPQVFIRSTVKLENVRVESLGVNICSHHMRNWVFLHVANFVPPSAEDVESIARNACMPSDRAHNSTLSHTCTLRGALPLCVLEPGL
jgi:hypothetical protein